jgi:phosphomannomutase
LMLEDGRPLSRIVGELPRYAIVKDKLDRPRDGGEGGSGLESVYGALRSEFAEAEADMQDGLRLSWPDRWIHVRPSGTEPIVRVIAEAPTVDEARELVRRSRVPLEALAP